MSGALREVALRVPSSHSHRPPFVGRHEVSQGSRSHFSYSGSGLPQETCVCVLNCGSVFAVSQRRLRLWHRSTHAPLLPSKPPSTQREAVSRVRLPLGSGQRFHFVALAKKRGELTNLAWNGVRFANKSRRTQHPQLLGQRSRWGVPEVVVSIPNH